MKSQWVANLQKVMDKDGAIKSGEEAVKVWTDHFRDVFQAVQPIRISSMIVCWKVVQLVQLSHNWS